MASACVNKIGVSPENFIDCPSSTFPAHGWMSPRISFSCEYSDEDSKIFAGAKPYLSDPADFEFRLDDPVKMLPADELFSDGKLVPLQLTTGILETEEAIRSPEERKSCSRNEVLSVADESCLFSPKAPRCSSRWRELLGLKKSKQESNSKSTSASNTSNTTSLSSSSPTNTGKSIRHFLHRTSKSLSAVPATEASLRLPLLKDSDCESISISSSRMSLSSSSSGHDHDDIPRLSLDSSVTNQSQKHPRALRMLKPRMVQVSIAENPKPLIDHPSAPTTTNRMPRAQQDPETITNRLSMDSPRMNSSGKIVFQSLERSCSSPSSFNGGPKYKNRGVERSYSANVRVTPVLNVPVYSKSCVLGFGQLFSSQPKKKESNGGSSKPNYHHHSSSRLRKTSS